MKIKKIKTITCHGVYNHGASLQEMALLYFLNSNDFDAKSISYKPSYLSAPHKLFSCQNPRWDNKPLFKVVYIALKLPSKLSDFRRRRAFDSFSEKYIPTTKLIYKSNKDLINNLPNADVFICGSDQIWNPIFPNGKDPAFYLDFAPKTTKRISYAASFATEELPEEHIPFVKEKVNALDFVSVRESSGKGLLFNIGITDVEQVLDPVFLLEPSYWNRFSKPEMHSKYIFIYDFDGNSHIKDLAGRIKEEFGFEIITVNKNIKYADKNYSSSGPDVFLNLIANAELILTTSFHALAFSIIFKKRVGVFNRNIAINTRMRDLLLSLGISKNLFNSAEVNLHDCDINFDELDPILNLLVNKSRKFILDVLHSEV